MNKPEHPFLRPKRVCVCGGTPLSPHELRFGRALGRVLGGYGDIILVSGGASMGSSEGCTADEAIIRAACDCIPVNQVNGRIETWLPANDEGKYATFHAGNVTYVPNRGRQGRRFVMIHSSDAIVAVGGGDATPEMVDLALSMGKPCLPVPFGQSQQGGTERLWRDHRAQILDQFHIDDDLANRWEAIKLNEIGDEAIEDLAREVATALRGGLARKCFVIMPFRPHFEAQVFQAIKEAAEQAGITAYLSKTLEQPGDAMSVVRDGINHCDFAVADITGNNGNVLYEIGFAHGLNKRVILIREKGSDSDLDPVKFDIRNDHRIDYTRSDLEALVETLASWFSA